MIDIDIKSCFPTICNFLFSEENPKFIEDIAKQPSKLEKNILISNTLKGTSYLKILNIISKMVCLGFIFDRQDSESVSLLEFEKDGCLIFINNISYYKSIENRDLSTPFQEFISINNFKFHISDYDYYIRCNNTSWFWSDNDKKLRIKGMFKHTPLKIQDFYENVFSSKKIDIELFIKIYNDISLKIIKNNNLQEILKDYYFCGDNKILNIDGKYEKYHWKTSQIDPSLYLKTFIFPVWVFQQRNLSGIV